MYNYKKAQRQGLLFYPWVKTHVDDETGEVYQNTERASGVYLEDQPVNIDRNTGEKYYKCNVCQDVVPEDEIASWEKRDEQLEKFTYPDNINTDNLKKDILNLYNLLQPYKKKFEEYVQKVQEQIDAGDIPPWDIYKYKSEWNDPGADVINFVKSSDEINKFCNLMAATEQYYGSNSYSYLCALGRITDIDGNVLGNLLNSDFFKDINEYINKYVEKISNPDFKKIDIKKKVPICDECYEALEKCEFCDKLIFEDDQSYRTTFGGRVCQDCIEEGTAFVCDECGEASSSDYMTYIEDIGTFCEDCASQIDNPEAYRDRIDAAAEQSPYPFKDWFEEGENHLYIPFTSSEKLSNMDELIRNTLSENGCLNSPIDYQKGYCHYQGRAFKIIKFLNKALHEQVKEIQNHNDWTDDSKQNEIDGLKEHYEELKKEFMKSEYRTIKDTSKLSVVITQDPEDIAMISTGRDWTSCMKLGTGAYFHDVFCFIEKGFLAAYLIDKDDTEIEHPYARILIRRLTNEDGVSIALPEDSVYGNAPPGFFEFVDEWLESKQSNLPKGIYKKIENAYSDTMSRSDYTYEKRAARLLAEAMMKYSNLNWYRRLKLS